MNLQSGTHYWPITFPDAPSYPALEEDLSCILNIAKISYVSKLDLLKIRLSSSFIYLITLCCLETLIRVYLHKIIGRIHYLFCPFRQPLIVKGVK